MLKLIKEISKMSRVAGTKQCNLIRDVFTKKLKALGYKTKFQRISFIGWKVIEKPEIKINGESVKVLPVLWSGSGKIQGILKVEASIQSKFIKDQHIYNIITKNNSKKKIVVCAHYDSILNSPGANDNVSGVSALIEVAKINKNIQYIFYKKGIDIIHFSSSPYKFCHTPQQ